MSISSRGTLRKYRAHRKKKHLAKKQRAKSTSQKNAKEQQFYRKRNIIKNA